MSPARRAADRARLAGEVVDVLVVGGGLTGAWVALDAASRGLAVGLLAPRLPAAGPPTTVLGRREGSRLARTTAPHLVRPVPLLVPLPAAARAVAALPGLLGPGLPAPRLLTRRAALAALPGLRRDASAGAVRCWGTRVDGARLALAAVRTAAGYGARVVPRTRVTGWLHDGDGDRGTVVGVRVTDDPDGSSWPVRALSVVATTAADHGPGSPHVELVLPGSAVRGDRDGLLLPAPHGLLSLVPDGDRWVVRAAGSDVRAVLGELDRVLVPPVPEDAVLAVRVEREPRVTTPSPGLVRVEGDGVRTARAAAVRAVDLATTGLPGVPPSRTAHLPLVGAHRWDDVRAGSSPPAAATGLPRDAVQRLLHRYGDRVADVLDLVRADPALGRPLPGAPAHLAAEVVHAVAAEGALDADDVLTRLGPVGREAGPAVAVLVSETVGRDGRHTDGRNPPPTV